MEFDYECAMLGTVSPKGPDSESDGLGDLPIGWTQITIKRRQYNPKWVAIQQIKNAMAMGLLAQFPEEIRESQEYSVSIQVEAQFYTLEKDTPQFLPDIDDTVYLSNDGELIESFNELRELLGLSPLITEEQEEAEEEGDESHLPHDSESGDS